MSWVATWRVPPPSNKTISVRFAGSVCFAYHHALLDKWLMIANGSEEQIEAPNLWWCSDKNLSGSVGVANQAGTAGIPPAQIKMRRSKRAQQLLLL